MRRRRIAVAYYERAWYIKNTAGLPLAYVAVYDMTVKIENYFVLCSDS